MQNPKAKIIKVIINQKPVNKPNKNLKNSFILLNSPF